MSIYRRLRRAALRFVKLLLQLLHSRLELVDHLVKFITCGCHCSGVVRSKDLNKAIGMKKVLRVKKEDVISNLNNETKFRTLTSAASIANFELGPATAEPGLSIPPAAFFRHGEKTRLPNDSLNPLLRRSLPADSLAIYNS